MENDKNTNLTFRPCNSDFTPTITVGYWAMFAKIQEHEHWTDITASCCNFS